MKRIVPARTAEREVLFALSRLPFPDVLGSQMVIGVGPVAKVLVVEIDPNVLHEWEGTDSAQILRLSIVDVRRPPNLTSASTEVSLVTTSIVFGVVALQVE